MARIIHLRSISAGIITQKTAELVENTALYLRQDILDFYKHALNKAENKNEKLVLYSLIQNAKIARDKKLPYCQDTGMEIIFCDIGQDVHIINGELESAIQEGIRLGSKNAYLRQSIVADPLIRTNTGTNAPGIIHFKIVPGNKIKLSCIAKGFGCENKGKAVMLNPTANAEDIKEFVISVIKEAGPNACPPFFVGIGIGGTMDKACELAKRTQLQPLGKRHAKPHLAKLETEILEKANTLPIGPLGLGGKLTCLDVKILDYPCHIAGLPVAVNIGCHAVRTGEIEL
ncbi:fumarate hydratase [Thermoproteota archaeon]